MRQAVCGKAQEFAFLIKFQNADDDPVPGPTQRTTALANFCSINDNVKLATVRTT